MKKRSIPKFKSEDDERAFWGRADSNDYVDWTAAERVVLPNLEPSQKTISLRLPAMTLAALKRLAHRRDVPYQSLMKVFITERLAEEQRRLSVKPVRTSREMRKKLLRKRRPVTAR